MRKNMDNSTINKKFFYSNTSKVVSSPYDVTVIFERSSAPDLPVKPKATDVFVPIVAEVMEVSMSPSHAKAVITGLLHVLVGYEQQFGMVNMPKEKNEEFNALIAQVKKGS
jgi:hypothetical protein